MRKLFNIMFSRYTISALLILLEVWLLIYLVIEMSAYSILFLILMLIVNFAVFVSVITSSSNPEHRLSWLALVLLAPIVGALIYILFRRPKMSKKEARLGEGIIREMESYERGAGSLGALASRSPLAAGKARAILSEDRLARVYRGTRAEYYALGVDMYHDMLADIASAKMYVFLEYFIIEEGVMWDGIHKALLGCVSRGVEVRLIYDDVGCIKTLPPDFCARLREDGISAVRFAPVTPRVSAAHNNRDHRKICVIDGRVAYTGGVNIADEYIGERVRFGVWKDGGVRVEGAAAEGFATLFLLNYDLTARSVSDYGRYIGAASAADVGATSASDTDVGTTFTSGRDMCAEGLKEEKKSAAPEGGESLSLASADREGEDISDGGFYIPLGSGPSPMYSRPVGKRAILDIVNQAKSYVYITTPYLIIDFDLTEALVGAVERGVDVRIVTPGIADKRIVKVMTKSSYGYLISHGVKIYEYTPGFMHHKLLVSDDTYAMVGTINMDYRSLVHHFEDALWTYGSPIIADIRADFINTLATSHLVTIDEARLGFGEWVIKCALRLFAPLL